MLEIKQETYEQEVKKSLQENKKKKEKLQNTNEEIYKKERMLEEKKEQYIQKNVEIEQTIEEKMQEMITQKQKEAESYGGKNKYPGRKIQRKSVMMQIKFYNSSMLR